MARVSVIVPVFRVKKYIRRCLESLLSQTLEDMEVIVVDDRGGDGSMDIVRGVQREHGCGACIKIVEMPCNSGSAAARNAGMVAASGEYIAFVDSDDWVEPRMYACLYEEAERIGAQWCYSHMVKDFPDGRGEALVQPQIERGLISDDTRKFILTHFVSYFTTGIYNREFLFENHIQFPPYRFSEDSFFTWMVVMHARTLGYVDERFYHYRIHSESVSNVYNPNKSQQRIDVFALLLDTLRKDGLYESYQAELDYLVIKKGWLLPLGAEALNPARERKARVRELVRRGKAMVPDYRRNLYLKKDKAVALLLRLFLSCPSIACFLFRIYARHNKKMVL